MSFLHRYGDGFAEAVLPDKLSGQLYYSREYKINLKASLIFFPREENRKSYFSEPVLYSGTEACYSFLTVKESPDETNSKGGRKMGRTRETGLMIAAAVLIVLGLSGVFRLLNGIIWRAGKIGVLIALFALVYTYIRKKG